MVGSIVEKYELVYNYYNKLDAYRGENMEMMKNKIGEMKEGQLIIFDKPKKYEFIRALSSGGTGKTILMKDATINEQFVCKKYDPEQKEYEEEFYKRFVDEIKIMYSVYDKNIVRIYDYFLYPEFKTGYIIMEYIQGVDIDEYFLLEDKENINEIFIQMINAFAYLAKNGILHRDVRAANIMIDNMNNVKIIDFGFGKKHSPDVHSEQASVILNWPASKIPNEIWHEVYNEKTEIYYVGYLIKNLVEKHKMKCFKYAVLLEKMIQINPDDRIETFEVIQNCIAEQTFEAIEFSCEQKTIYQEFAYEICDAISVIHDKLVVEYDDAIIIEKMRAVLRDNCLEEYITKPSQLISCFIKSNYRFYSNKRIEVEDVKKFFDFFTSQAENMRKIILDNLYGRMDKIEVQYNIFDGELPFN